LRISIHLLNFEICDCDVSFIVSVMVSAEFQGTVLSIFLKMCFNELTLIFITKTRINYSYCWDFGSYVRPN